MIVTASVYKDNTKNVVINSGDITALFGLKIVVIYVVRKDNKK